MNFEHLEIPEVIMITPKVFEDDRGYFFEAFRENKFQENGMSLTFLQENQSSSVKGTLRGLHYQKEPFAQGKLVRCLVGEIFDVAVDIRKNSSTYKKWVGKILSDKNKTMLYIPEGFLHGFYVLSEQAVVNYKCTAYYNPKAEDSVIWNDKSINIDWPILSNTPLIISKKDQEASIL
ncbi:MAG: dTDP-4-dehydrorhamnose 3,5-epimerase [Candidatus Margulisiibacteriota bacterium]|jgi:dTDP-4-dehydrorhamnose 3,5-epimerase